MSTYHVTITLKSPLSLGSGQGNVNVDADVIHDEYGMPYFPGKRLRGLLYESAVEVTEMAGFATFVPIVNDVFRRTEHTDVRLIIPNFYLPDYETMKKDWQYVQQHYGDCIQAEHVLEEYTSLRYQTSIDKDTGTALDSSLHNIRVLDNTLSGTTTNVSFVGNIELIHGRKEHAIVLALALQNLCAAGMKRNRGFGKISCGFTDKKLQDSLIEEAFVKGGLV